MADQGQMEKDILSCSICLELLKDPKTLTCMHRYCESCLNLHIVSSTARTSDPRPGFSCPECREFIPAPDSSSLKSIWASQFKTDFKIKTLVELFESKQEIKVAKVNSSCAKHEDKEQELYCFDCSATVCHLCAVISHRGCNKIGTVTEAAQELRATWQACVQQLPNLKKEALQTEKYRDSYTTEINKKKDCLEKGIREHAERMRQLVTGEEEKLLERVQAIYNHCDRHVSVFTNHLDTLKFWESFFSSKLKTQSDFEFVLHKDYLDEMDLYLKEGQDRMTKFSNMCTLVSKLEWSFLPLDIPCTNLGNVELKNHE